MLLSRRLHGTQSWDGMALRGALGCKSKRGGAEPDRSFRLPSHAAAIRCVVPTTAFLGLTLPLIVIRYFVAAIMVGLGSLPSATIGHPRWVECRLSFET